MLKEIKFRGQLLDGTDFVYGSYVAPISFADAMIVDDLGDVHSVKQYTVRQFIGWDCDGKELYDGDKVTDADCESDDLLKVGLYEYAKSEGKGLKFEHWRLDSDQKATKAELLKEILSEV